MGDYGPDAGSHQPEPRPAGLASSGTSSSSPASTAGPTASARTSRTRTSRTRANAGAGTVKGDYNCAAPVNDSPNNTGLTNLPPAIPASMWMGYSETDIRFPDLGTGGAPMGGARYYFDEDSRPPTPSSRGSTTASGSSASGTTTGSRPPTSTTRGSSPACPTGRARTGYISPMDMEFGPDGSLYVVEWGQGFAENNADSGVYRVDYISGARTPIANATVNNDAVPVGTTVQFSSAGSNDPDGTHITYLWNFGDGTPTSTAAEPVAHLHGGRHLRRDADGHGRVRRLGGGHGPRGRRQPAAGRDDRAARERQGRRLRRQGPVQDLGGRSGRRHACRLQPTSASRSSSATTRTRTSCPTLTGCEGDFTVTGVGRPRHRRERVHGPHGQLHGRGQRPRGAGHRHRRGDPAAQAQAGRVLRDHRPHGRRSRHR